jgi:hypothetical protein
MSTSTVVRMKVVEGLDTSIKIRVDGWVTIRCHESGTACLRQIQSHSNSKTFDTS